MFPGLFLYIILMTGIMMERGEGKAPYIVCASAILPWLWYYRKFLNIHWTDLPFGVIMTELRKRAHVDAAARPEKEDQAEGSEQVLSPGTQRSPRTQRHMLKRKDYQQPELATSATYLIS